MDVQKRLGAKEEAKTIRKFNSNVTEKSEKFGKMAMFNQEFRFFLLDYKMPWK